MATATSFDGTKIAFRTRGEFKAELVKTGRMGLVAACDGAAFNKFDEVMSQGGPTVSMDLRGSGGSDHPKSVMEYSVPAYSKDIVAVMGANKAERAVVVGYSHASEGVVNLAVTEPERVSALVLIEPTFFVDRSLPLELARLAEARRVEDALRLTIAFSNPGLSGKEVEEGIKFILKTYDDDAVALAGEWRARAMFHVGEAQLARIKAPTLVIGGTESNIKDEVSRAARSIPNASLFWLHGATHFLDEDQGRRAAEITRAFVSSIRF